MHRSKHLQPLSHQHHDGLMAVLLLKKGLQKNASSEIMCAFIMDLWEPGLRQHFFAEELHLQPDQLMAPATAPFYARMKEEHAAIRELILSMKDGLANGKTIRLFAELLEKHIRFEERIYFEAIQSEVPAKQLAAIGTQLQSLEQERTCVSFPHRFWE